MNGWEDGPKFFFTARADNNRDWSQLYVQNWKPDRIGATGMNFHHSSLVSMGRWIEFDRETGDEIFPEWRIKHGDVEDPEDLLRIDKEFLALIKSGDCPECHGTGTVREETGKINRCPNKCKEKKWRDKFDGEKV